MLQNVRTASPCSAGRKKMAGDEQVIFCSECNRNVYNLSAMTGDEIVAPLASQERRTCDRRCRQADRTLLTKNCLVGFRAAVGRGSQIAGMVFGAAMCLSLAAAQQAPKTASPPPIQIEAQKTAALTIRIKDQTDALVPGARVLLTSASGLARVAEGETDKAGELSLSKLQPGAYAIEVEFPGFSMTKQNVVLSAGVMSKVDVHGTLHPAVVGDVVVAPKHPVLNHLKDIVHKIHF
jgi:Carboxypeptidase regulatory-like domain